VAVAAGELVQVLDLVLRDVVGGEVGHSHARPVGSVRDARNREVDLCAFEPAGVFGRTEPVALVGVGRRALFELLGDLVGDTDGDVSLSHVPLERLVFVVGGATHREEHAAVEYGDAIMGELLHGRHPFGER
jgi:hypothetical protein